jgi:hypothetical protein
MVVFTWVTPHAQVFTIVVLSRYSNQMVSPRSDVGDPHKYLQIMTEQSKIPIFAGRTKYNYKKENSPSR